ncbi:VOC family protein [Pseudoclavibacter endophyticus]|uniref:VOC family protein n=1 Tax=Pseudoclavibacter endophyticus TaxID=1778590 RepID=A0A6H9WQF0_9MICO|nr:VOC family protein [Pseudoclavibacter endophyticus]KAB1648265.1 VOC family protein [Pseudoclavibacter endophyticus]GGA71161.1 VOC family protein [Pseudoclavibacter endophyticus]
MTNLMPYLNFPGTTREAMTFYHEALGGEVGFSTYGEFGAAPEGSPAFDKIMHAQLVNDTLRLMASDVVEGFGPPVTYGNNYAVSLVGPEEEQLTEIFNRLSEGGTVEMPLEQQVWGDRYGSFTDKFGVPWMVNIEVQSAEGAGAGD